MMPFAQQVLKNLMQHRSPHSISIYMPTHRAGRETQQDPIRLKNLLREAENQMTEANMRRPDIATLLAPATDLINDSEFWRHQGDGLAIFLSEEETHIHQLPLHVYELLVISEHFHTRPLLPLATNHYEFFVLALSQHTVKLFRATQYDIREVALDNVPTSLAEALRYDDPESQLQQHSPGAGDKSTIFHRSDPTDQQKNDILRFFNKVNAGIVTLLSGETIPMILAGVDYLLPLYRQANSYPHLLNDHNIIGNPEQIPNDRLRQKAWAQLAPHFLEQEEAQFVERILKQDGKSITSTGLQEILRAAHHGRIDTLIIAEGERHWGTYDAESDRLQLQSAAAPGNCDLLDRAAAQTFLNGGTVHIMPKGKLPVDEPAVAVFRY
jgi:hypothetical protein